MLQPAIIAPPPFMFPVMPLACVGEDPDDIVVERDIGFPQPLEQYDPCKPARAPLPGLRPTTIPPPVSPVRPPPIIRQNDGNDLTRRGLRHEPVLGPGGGSHNNRW
jgi:hypothetical protein